MPDASSAGARRWIIAQIGARQHYAVPIALHERGALRAFFTDAWCSHGRFLLERAGGRGAALAARFSPLLPPELVRAFTLRTATRELLFRGAREDLEAAYRCHLRGGIWFGKRVARELGRLRLDPGNDAFFGFTTGSLEVIELLRSRSVFTLVDQIDAARLEKAIAAEERRAHPGWEREDGRVPEEYWHRVEAEWHAADAVLVNSEWSRSALVKQGVPEHKIIVVPLAYHAAPPGSPPSSERRGRLTVLWLGTVSLAKGIAYLLEAARLLESEAMEFVVVGSIRISPEAIRSAPGNVRFVGPALRAEVERWYRSSDIFVHPTLSDGFGLTQLEAMAHGLPVVSTPRCGKVVTDGVDGLIVPAADGGALAAALARLHADRALRREMSVRALATVQRFTRAAYATNLEQELGRLGSSSNDAR